MEICQENLCQRSAQILPTEVLSRSCIVKRSCQETFHRDLEQKFAEKSNVFAQRFFCRDLEKNLTWRSLPNIFYGDLL
jgi:hypothetical protein